MAKRTDKTRCIKLGILLSGGGTTMVNIARKIESGELNAKIAIVIASNDKAKGIDRAREYGFDVIVVHRKEFNSTETFSEKVWSHLRSAGVELVCLSGFLSLITIPKDYVNKVMNIHPALLPKFGGKGMYGHHVHKAVIKSGYKTSGCTVHFADAEYDNGPIILQRTCRVEKNDTPETLAARVFEQECIAFPQAIRMFAEGRIKL